MKSYETPGKKVKVTWLIKVFTIQPILLDTHRLVSIARAAKFGWIHSRAGQRAVHDHHTIQL